MDDKLEILQAEFDRLKDHKPKSFQKLDKLANIFSETYEIDPDTANDMWKYLVDHNISRNNADVASIKFYISQLYKYLLNVMSTENATNLVSMDPERLNLMIFHSYDGGTLWDYFDWITTGLIKAGDMEKALSCTHLFWIRFKSIVSGSTGGRRWIEEFIRHVQGIYKDLNSHNMYKDVAREYYARLISSENQDISRIALLFNAIDDDTDIVDYERAFDIALEYKFPVEYYKLLWIARKNYKMPELKEKWEEYIESCDEDDVRPYAHLNEYRVHYEDSKTSFYVQLEKSSNSLLNYYFNRPVIYPVEAAIIWEWVESEDWEQFVKYVSIALMNGKNDSFLHSSVKGIIDKYMFGCLDDEYRNDFDNFGRSFKELMAVRTDGFIDAISTIYVATIGCEAFDSISLWIKHFIQKKTGDLSILNKNGVQEQIEERTAEERMVSYAREFLQSGELKHDQNSIRYQLICHDLYKERYRKRTNTTLGFRGEPIIEDQTLNGRRDLSVEQFYRFALNDSVTDFIFCHCFYEHDKKAEMISACIKKGNINRAIVLIDKMLSLKDYPGYNDLNGWGRQNMLTMMHLIYKFDQTNEWRLEDGITNEMLLVVKELVLRIMPSLLPHERDELKANIYRIGIDTAADYEEYISDILKKVDQLIKYRYLYSSKNRCVMNDGKYHGIVEGFRMLSCINRLDVITLILLKFEESKDTLYPSFEKWISIIISQISSDNLYEIYKSYRNIFNSWIETDIVSSKEVCKFAEKIRKSCTLTEFESLRNRILASKGSVEGLELDFHDPL